jgi:proline racemase
MNAHMKLMRQRSKKERAPRSIITPPTAEPRKRSPHGSAQNARLRLMRKRGKMAAAPTPAEAEKAWTEWSKANNEETE